MNVVEVTGERRVREEGGVSSLGLQETTVSMCGPM